MAMLLQTIKYTSSHTARTNEDIMNDDDTKTNDDSRTNGNTKINDDTMIENDEGTDHCMRGLIKPKE
jgi:hypothetical protein